MVGSGLGIISGEHVRSVPLSGLSSANHEKSVEVISAFETPRLRFDSMFKKAQLDMRKRRITEDPKVWQGMF